METARKTLVFWQDAVLDLHILADDEGQVRLVLGADVTNDNADVGLPLVDVMVAGIGREWAGLRYSESTVGHRMRYVDHAFRVDGSFSVLDVTLRDPITELTAIVEYRRIDGAGVLSSSVTLRNDGDGPLTIEAVSSLLLTGLAGPGGDLHDVDILWAENDWQTESRWQSRAYRDAVPQCRRSLTDGVSRGRYAVTSVGTWSTGTYLPMGAAVNRRTGHTLLWEILNNGAWRWEVGEYRGGAGDPSYLSLLGPTDIEHHWRTTPVPGESLQSVPVALAVSADGLEGAIAGLARHRRAVRRDHPDNRELPIVFNDFMNTVMANPSTERLMPLITAAAKTGAEYFVIDAGWYAAPDEDWWDSVGEWRPNEARFSNGLKAVIDHIRAEGMIPGIWLEPEVVGVRSPLAATLPEEAFFVLDGVRVVEQRRYHLDFSHPAVRAHLDATVDFLVAELGIGYFKFDYNIDLAPGTDAGNVTAGVGMLRHGRAYLEWVDAVLDRHPGVTLEACSSGAMRCDNATLAHFQLQSTSDQGDPLDYPPIAAAAPMAMLPEQAAVWTAVQPEMSDDEITFTLAGALLGRMHISGNVDRMTEAQQRLIAEAVEVYRSIRADIPKAVPFWPLGLPGWQEPWVALGLRATTRTYLLVWRRVAADGSSSPTQLAIPIDRRAGAPRVLFPENTASVELDSETSRLTVLLPRTPTACLIAWNSQL